MKEIDEAVAQKDLKRVLELTGLPIDVVVGQRTMTRKERRAWYHTNRKRLSLPTWGGLDTLTKK